MESKPALREAQREKLEVAWSQAERFLKQSKSENTIKAYRSDWQHFSDWCLDKGLAALPATPETVALYLSDLASSNFKFSTIRRRSTSINKAHQIEQVPSPVKSAVVSDILSGIKRALGNMQKGKAPLLTVDILKMISTLPSDLRGIRDRALLLVGFAGCFRRSELVALDVRDVEFRSEGLVLLMRRSKVDQSGEGEKKAIPNGTSPSSCPGQALRTWLEAADIKSGPVFRGINRHGQISQKRLTGRSVALIVKRTAQEAGLDPNHYAGHSLRSGLATQAAISGVTERAIIKQGGWKSEKMARRYIRDGSLFRDNAAGQVGL